MTEIKEVTEITNTKPNEELDSDEELNVEEEKGKLLKVEKKEE